jgi:hypothetical protein
MYPELTLDEMEVNAVYMNNDKNEPDWTKFSNIRNDSEECCL